MVEFQACSTFTLLRILPVFLIVFWALHEAQGPVVTPKTNTTTVLCSLKSTATSLHLCWFMKRIIKRGSSSIRDLLLRSPAYQSTADLKPLPDQPKRMVQMLFSIIVSNSNLTNPINDAILDCISTATYISVQQIGLYNAETFTRSMLQAEYYADVTEVDSETFPENLDAYIRRGNLTDCVHGKDVGLAAEGVLFNGRTTIAPRIEAIVSSAGLVPGWIVGAVVGVLAVITVVGLTVLAITGSRLYPESAYRREQSSGSENNFDHEGGQVPEHIQQEILRELKTIAGQRTDTYFAPV